MRNASFTRHLKPTEIDLARNVFHSALPPWIQIGITDGLGAGDTVWTMTRSMIPFSGVLSTSVNYYINFGDAARVDLSVSGVGLGRYVRGYSDHMADVFVHELTHVWQYSRRYADAWDVAARCVYAQTFGAGYRFTAGRTWASYNLEQQASIVEEWKKRGRKEDDELFPYIHYIIRKEGEYVQSNPSDRTVMGIVYSEFWFADVADLAQLKLLLDGERMPVAPPPEPIRIMPKDDSFIVILKGDVLFDFDKADLKPAADWSLEQAWTRIKANPRRRVIYINGHTDSVGDKGYNMRLSERRAQAVAQWFFRRGYLTPSVVRPQGFGEAQPVASNTIAEGRAKNRRVEIYLSNT
jgi:outer membrane protein OmpA-like peptidoglycan-associated protein